MKDNGGQALVNVTVRLSPTDKAMLRAEALRRAQAGERYDYSRLVREALHLAPWTKQGGGDAR